MAALAHAQDEISVPPTSDLWARWHATGDQRARDSLVAHYAEWARKLARDVFMRVRGRSADWPDYVQNASVGLMEAMAGYDPARGVPFEAFARHRVRGAVFNGLRALTATHAATRVDAWRDAYDSLLDTDDSDPFDRMVKMVSALGLGHAMSSHFEAEHATTPTPYDEAVKYQLNERIARHLARLPEKERLILQLHYLQHMPFVDIAGALGVTKGRISQLHRQALERLRSHMAAEAWQFAL